MSISTVCDRLATLASQIPGVVHAFADVPDSLVETDLPAVIPLPGPNQIDDQEAGADFFASERDYDLYLYVAPAGSGVVPGEIERRCKAFIDPFVSFFMARPSLGRLTGVQNAVLITDSGVTALQFGQDVYRGVRFTLHVSEIVTRTYAKGE